MQAAATRHPSVEGPVTLWLCALRQGDESAARHVWSAYFHRVRGFARRMLRGRGRVRRTCDGEDIAASAFRSFYRGTRAGEFPALQKRQDLWPLLAALTSHKCIDRARREARVKRGGLAGVVDSSALAFLPDGERAPEDLVELTDLRDRLLATLDAHEDPTLRQIVQCRLEGESIGSIAQHLGCVRRTVERKLRLVRELWENQMS